MVTTMPQLDADLLLEMLRSNGCATQFQPDAIPESVLERILEAGCQTPSPWNLQPWQFVVVRSEAGRARVLHHCAQPGAAATAPVLLIALGDPAAWKRAPERLTELVHNGNLAAGEELAQLEQIRRQWSVSGADRLLAIARTHAAVQQLCLASTAFGVGLGWAHEFDPARLARALHIPDSLVVVAVLGLGYCAERAVLPAPSMPRMVFAEAYGLPWRAPVAEPEPG